MRDTSYDFNKSAELTLQKKMGRYDLSQEEKQKINDVLKSRNEDLKKLENNYIQNWNELYKTQYNELKAKQRPQLNLEMGKTNLKEHEVRQMAKDKVRLNNEETKNHLHSQADKQIKQVLDKAKEEGRYQGLDYQNENQRTNNRDR